MLYNYKNSSGDDHFLAQMLNLWGKINCAWCSMHWKHHKCLILQHDENINIHELNKWTYNGHIVVWICCLELCVIHVANDGGL
jgi:hypothetical protein